MCLMISFTSLVLFVAVNADLYKPKDGTRIITGGRGIYTTIYPEEKDVNLYSKTYSGVRSYPEGQTYHDDTYQRDDAKAQLSEGRILDYEDRSIPTISHQRYGHDPANSNRYESRENGLLISRPRGYSTERRRYFSLPVKQDSINERIIPIPRHINYEQGQRNDIDQRIQYNIKPQIGQRYGDGLIGHRSEPKLGFGINYQNDVGHVSRGFDYGLQDRIQHRFRPTFKDSVSFIAPSKAGIGYGIGPGDGPYEPLQGYPTPGIFPSFDFPPTPLIQISPIPPPFISRPHISPAFLPGSPFPPVIIPSSPIPPPFIPRSPISLPLIPGLPTFRQESLGPILRYQRVLYVIPEIPIQKLQSLAPVSGQYRAEIRKSIHPLSLVYKSEVRSIPQENDKSFTVTRKTYSSGGLDIQGSSEYDLHESSQ